MKLVVRVRPTVTVAVEGERVGDQIVLTGGFDEKLQKGYEIGLPGQGWAKVGPVWFDLDAEVWRWDIKSFTALPGYVRLPSYDLGHQVVVVDGEFMGATGAVTDARSLPDSKRHLGEAAYVLSGGAAHMPQALGALWDGSSWGLEALTPLPVEFPVGTPVWVWHRGTTGAWHAAFVTGWTPWHCEHLVLATAEQMTVERRRGLVVHRNDNVKPAPLQTRYKPPTRRARGRAPAPRRAPF